MSVETHTEPQVKKLVDAVQEDLSSASEWLTKGHEIIAALEDVAKGVNGLASSCRGWSNQLTEMLSQIEAESESVERKMMGGNGKAAPITEHVDHELAEAAISAAVREEVAEGVGAS